MLPVLAVAVGHACLFFRWTHGPSHGFCLFVFLLSYHPHPHTRLLRQRGDGFPLAHMLAHVAAETKDMIPVLTAHIYTVCPTAIPTLPHIAPDASEEELMQSLGMLRGKDGQFETFPRFLSRTEVC